MIRLIDDPAWRARDRELRQAFTRWDRSTAFGCQQRGIPFDPVLERLFWDQWQAVLNLQLSEDG